MVCPLSALTRTLPQLELSPVGTLPRLELCPSWISLFCRTHLLGIIRKKIRSLLFSHHLDENLDLNLEFVILANPFDVAIEAFDAWNIAMCLHSFK